MTTRRRTLLAASALGLAAAGRGLAGPTPAMRGIGSVPLSRLMGVGWNLGNALEAIGGETAWGNPPATPALLAAVKAAGFDTVRIPVAWQQYADADDRIGAAWLARVAQVVDAALDAGLYTLINIHWDGGWMQPLRARQAAVNARLARYWTQIATHFRDHGDRLLFAGTNEVMKDGDYGPPTAEYAEVQNGFNQVFVDAVRATGGNNRQRHLVVQGYNTNIDHTLKFAVLPTDPTPDRLMMEVHYYDPYHFTIDEKSAIWQWGSGTTDPAVADTWGNEAHAEAQFAKMKAQYVDRGVAVIVGEYGVIARVQPGAEAYRIAWNRHVTRSALRHGLVPVYWDNGVAGKHGMGLFDRLTGAQVYPELVRAIVESAR